MVVAAGVIRVARVRSARVGQIEHQVHLGRGQRNWWRVKPHVAGGGACTVRLHQRAGVARVGFQVQHAVGVRVQHRVALDLLVARQANHGAVTWRHHLLADTRGQRRVVHEGDGLGCRCFVIF